ncbi:hypothetical protein [Streptomyces violens]|uniref:hypothetical protein n=1 Tax=Streptomyces violens TaxID=66377 RepID=UPI0007C6F24E|nr:hypothetical protein [Streptomyces violens]
MTTDRQGTRALEWESVDVRWLSCTASAPNGGRPAPTGTAAATPAAAGDRARVDCQGETVSGERITIRGPVTREVSGRCVEGNNLTARVGDRVVFRTNTIGNCDAPAADASPDADNPGNPDSPDNPGNPDDSGNPGNSDNPGSGSDEGGNENGGGGGQNGDGHDDGKWQEDGKWHDDGKWQDDGSHDDGNHDDGHHDDGNHDDCPDGEHGDDGKWHDGKDDNGDAHGDRAARQ